ncbi:MAG: dTDP-glucose 4,6-dehydratase [Clostridia bacterium]|nr:dTDP-glucose 4,6-dehydratase [Clostridia bacterium]
MKTYLITGGAGFIGTNFIYFLFEKYKNNIRIINIDKLTYAANCNNLNDLDAEIISNGNYIFKKIDICNNTDVDCVFNEFKPDYVVNFAAESHVDRSIHDPSQFILTNICGVQVLLEASVKYKVKRFHQVSTDEVYGSLGDSGFFTEESPLEPHSPYSASKASADLICQSYFHTYKMPVTISRCTNNYGPYQHEEKFIPLMVCNILKGIKLPIYGDGLNVRDWIYVKDHCSAIDKIINEGTDGEVYNVGSNNETTNLEMVEFLMDAIKSVLPDEDPRRCFVNHELITFIEDRKGHDRRYAIDASKIKMKLGWSPNMTFEKGIIETVKWYINNTQCI